MSTKTTEPESTPKPLSSQRDHNAVAFQKIAFRVGAKILEEVDRRLKAKRITDKQAAQILKDVSYALSLHAGTIKANPGNITPTDLTSPSPGVDVQKVISRYTSEAKS